MSLVNNFCMFVQIGYQFIVGDMHTDMTFCVFTRNLLTNSLLEKSNIDSPNRRDKNRIRIFFTKLPQERRIFESINLVENLNNIVVNDPDFLQRIAHHRHLLLKTGVADIDHMEEKISLQYLVKSRFKTFHKSVRQFAYKTNRIR